MTTIEKMAEALKKCIRDMEFIGTDFYYPAMTKAQQALIAYESEKGKYTRVITERLDEAYYSNCPSLDMPCPYMKPDMDDCQRCWKAHLTGEEKNDGRT